MTDEAGWVALGVKPVLDRGFGSGLSRDLDPALARVGRSSGHRFGALMGKAAVAGAAGVIGLGFAAFRIGQDAFAEARESQKVAALTAAAIKSTGGAAKVSAGQVDKLSNAIGKKAAIDDETIASGLNMLLSFKNIRNEAGKGNKIFNRAAHETTDYAAAIAAASGGQVNMAAASIAVGKALNDPVGGISALKKKGVDFTDAQKDQIKTLVESGNIMKAQKIILRELGTEYGGVAASQATMGDKVEFAWKNIEERLGTDLLPLLNRAEKTFLQKGVPAIEGWVDAFEKKGVPALKHFYDRAKPVAEDVLPKFRHVLSVVKDDLVIAAPYAKDLVDAFAGMPDWAQKVIVGGGLAAFAGKKLGLGSLLGSKGGVAGLVSKSRPIPVFVVNGGAGLPGVGESGTAGKVSKIPKNLLLAGTAGLSIGSIGIGAEALAAFLGSRPAASDPARAKRYHDTTTAPGFKAELRKTPFMVNSIDPRTGLPSITVNVDAKAYGKTVRQIEALDKKIEPTFDILGLVEADAKVKRFRDKAGRPVEVPIVAKVDNAIANLFGDAFGGGSSAGRHRGLPGVTVHGDLNIHATDHKDFMRKAQASALGGRRP